MATLTYRIFDETNVPDALFRFRYKVYVEEMGRPQKDACHKTKTIRDSFDEKAFHVVAFADDEVVGCVRLNFLRDIDPGFYFDFFDIGQLPTDQFEAVSLHTRLMVDPKYRTSRVTHKILLEVYKVGVYRDIKHTFVDCNDHLVRFFKRWGFKFYGKKSHDEYGEVNLARLDMCDLEHLKSVRSPLSSLCVEYFENQMYQTAAE